MRKAALFAALAAGGAVTAQAGIADQPAGAAQTTTRMEAQTPAGDAGMQSDVQNRARTQTQDTPGRAAIGSQARIQENAWPEAHPPGDPRSERDDDAAGSGGGQVMSQPVATFDPVQRGEYPPCSATVTDNCVQRGGR